MFRSSRWLLGLLFLSIVCVVACSPADEAAEPVAEPSAAEEENPERAAMMAIIAAGLEADPAAVIASVDEFVEAYPESRSKARMLQRSILAAAKMDPEGAVVLDRVQLYVDAYTENNDVAMAYNGAASTLMDAEVHLTAAAEYADKALAELADDASDRQRVSILQTVAQVRFAEGKNAEAIEYQRQALELSPDSFVAHASLGKYLLAEEEFSEAGRHLAWAALRAPDSGDSLDNLRELADNQTANDAAANEYLATVIGSTADAMLEASDDPDELKITLATSFTTIGVLTDRALAYAEAGVAANGPEAGVDPYVSSRVAYAQVKANMGEYAEALATLEPIASLASSFNVGFHLTRGRSLEALGREDEAIEAYLEGNPDRSQIRERLEPLWEEHRTGEDLDAVIEANNEALENWHPDETFTTPDDWSGKVVLAELFTGAQCGPCAAADVAYDGLIAYYPRAAVAVLENHVHIPGPDPMVNADVVDRLDYYGREIVRGAPTAIIDGTQNLVGGGGKAAGRNRFGVYRWLIDREMDDAPMVEIEIEGVRSGETVEVAATVRPRPGLGDVGDLRLRIALAEKLVHYEGSNGIAEHRMVNRKFIGGAEGFALDADGSVSVQEAIDLAELQDTLLAYLIDFEEDPPERHSDFEGFTEKKNEIDIEALMLIAFVQNDATREVLQAKVFDLR